MVGRSNLRPLLTGPDGGGGRGGQTSWRGRTSWRGVAWYPARRSGFLRHTALSAEGCCRQALTRFAAPRCAEPDRRARYQDKARSGVARGTTLACLHAGGVRERPNRHDWKSCVGKLTVGSNPTLSARKLLVTGAAGTSKYAEWSPTTGV